MQLATVLTAIVLVFVLDRVLPDGLGVHVLYVPLILFATWQFAPRVVWIVFGICAGLTILDCELEWIALPKAQLWTHLVNDAILIIVGLVVTALALARNRYITPDFPDRFLRIGMRFAPDS